MKDNLLYAAAIQMVSANNVDSNLEQVKALIKVAAAKGAKFILLPENFAFMGDGASETLAIAEKHQDGKIQNFVSELAVKHKVTIAAGSIPIISSAEKATASCLVYNEKGEEVARYDKKHLFDVYIKDSQESYKESDTYDLGNKIEVIETSIGKVGLSICYDIRFPEMYREMHKQGVQIIVAPSAFTEQTGRVHWEPLLKARAIENLCYVIAANQGGIHSNGRKTYGHSMIIDPWGKIISRIGTGAGVIVSQIDLQLQEKIRQEFPALQHC